MVDRLVNSLTGEFRVDARKLSKLRQLARSLS